MSELFKDLSNALADTVEATAAGLVRIDGRKRMGATAMVWREGILVTADHVIRRDDGLTLGLPGGEKASATLVGRDKHTDLAVLRTDADLTPLQLATDADALRVGNLVLAVGRPREQVQVTMGIVSAIGSRRMHGVIQTDVVMYPGFSGGPLVDAAGLVQGMNTSGFSRGASIAIATDTINNVVDTLLEYGKVRQGFLGVGAQPVRLPEATARELNQETGLIIVSVEHDSPAEQGGIVVGDIIVSLDGETTPHLDALLMSLSGERVGQTVPVKLVRGGQLTELTVTVGDRS